MEYQYFLTNSSMITYFSQLVSQCRGLEVLDWGLSLDAPIEKREIAGCEVFFVAGNTLAACFAKGGEVGTDLCEALARHRSEYGDPLLRLVFRDAGFANDTAKINAEQLFKQLSPNTDLRTL